MKKVFITLSLAAMTLAIHAKDLQTLVVTTTPKMHCASCENKIKNNIRFEKGVKNIATDLQKQTVTIVYDADKNTAAKLVEAFGRFGYKAEAVKAKDAQEKTEEKQSK